MTLVRPVLEPETLSIIVNSFDIAYFAASLLQKESMKRNLFFMV